MISNKSILSWKGTILFFPLG